MNVKEFSLTSIPYFDLIRENLRLKEMEEDSKGDSLNSEHEHEDNKVESILG
jgi:predicted solute-binding protein